MAARSRTSRATTTQATVFVEGLNEFRRDLKRVGAELPKALAEANQRAAEIVAEEAKRRAPKGPHQGGGSITPIVDSIRALRQQLQAVVAVGGARTPHAQAYEFGGTLRRFHSAKRTRVRKRPYLYPAIAAKQAEVVEAYGGLLDQVNRTAFPD